jgi:beta-carotene 3-hydroxylase
VLKRLQVAMEMYARWAHRALWHDFEPGWRIHASHHTARTGPFEANDIFAVANALPAFALTAYGFFTPSMLGGLCFGFGMGVTVFGIMYMFVHDGLVHKRFPVGPIAELPQLKRIAIAHRLHHSEKYDGLPFGMFLGPQELEAAGAGAELERLVEEMKLSETKVARDKAAK